MLAPKDSGSASALGWHSRRLLASAILLLALGSTFPLPAAESTPAANAAAVAAAAAIEAGWHPETNYPPLPPEQALRTIEVPPGYRLQCVASSPRP